MIQAAVGFCGGSGGFSTKRPGLVFATAAASLLAGRVDLADPTIADLVWRHQANASMRVILIIAIEEASAERLYAVDAAGPPRACTQKKLRGSFDSGRLEIFAVERFLFDQLMPRDFAALEETGVDILGF